MNFCKDIKLEKQQMSNCVWWHADAVLPALTGSASQLFSKAKTKTDCASSGKQSWSCCCCWCCDKFVLAAEGAALSTARLLVLDLTMYCDPLTFIWFCFSVFSAVSYYCFQNLAKNSNPQTSISEMELGFLRVCAIYSIRKYICIHICHH